MKKTIEQICLWKIISIRDESRLKQGDNCIILDPEKKCYSCDGYFLECDKYLNSTTRGKLIIRRDVSDRIRKFVKNINAKII